MRAVKLIFPICVAFAHCLTPTEIFRDNFNSNRLNESKWNSVFKKSEVNGELEYFIPEHVTIENALLVITTKKETFLNSSYTSGRVDTRNKFDFKYGEIEFRAKVPRGRGIWTAFFLLDYRCLPVTKGCEFWPPSVSIADIRGDLTDQVVTRVYFNGAPSYLGSTFSNSVDFSEDFHLYKLLWTSEELVWFVDNRAVFRVNESEKIPQTRMQIIMSVAVGGSFPGDPDQTTIFPTHLYIDYVVVRQELDSSKSKLLGLVLGAIGGILFLATILVIVFLWIRRKKKQLAKGNVGTFSDEISITPTFTPRPSIDFVIDPELQFYANLIEVPLANLQISDDLLGSGEYGMVHKGLVRGLRGQPGVTKVAIKSVLPSSSPETKAMFLEEMKLMTKVGRHLNIVNLLGVVYKGKNLLILEYCPFGSLAKYLKTHQGAYLYIHVDDSGILLAFDENEYKRLEKEAAEMCHRQTLADKNFDERVLSTNDCMNFAYQISRGMEFLASKQITHRDLAARNILVSQNQIVKISDFGLARQNEGDGEYLSSAHVALPVKWMPPESIVEKKFSQKSDVWSFGILLWEIFSAGEVPFSKSEVGAYVVDLVAWLQKGFHMERPSAAPLEIYIIMKKCWNLNVGARPNFSELRLDLEQLVNGNCYFDLDLPYQKFNLGYKTFLSCAMKNEERRFVVPENSVCINKESTF